MGPPQDMSDNTRESVGEIRGELTSLSRQMEQIAATIHQIDLRLVAQTTDVQVHLEYHRVAEKTELARQNTLQWRTNLVIGFGYAATSAVLLTILRLLHVT